MPDASPAPSPGHRVRRLLAFPPRGESDAARLSRLLQAFLVLSLGVTAAFLVLAGPALNARAVLLTVSLLAGLGALSLLARVGWTRLAAALYLGGLWLFVTLALWLFGGFHGPAATAYTVVALGAALLFGTRGAAAATAVIGASGVFIALAEVRGWLPSTESPGATTPLFIFLASLLSLVGMALYATAELRHAIEGLRESEGRVRSIVESSPMAILLYELEPSGRLVLTASNPAGDRVLGIPVAALVGRTIEEAFPGIVGTEALDRYRRICADGGSWEAEVEYRDDRFRGVYEVHAFRTAPGMLAVMFLDISERRRAEEERRRLEDQLRQSQKMEAVGRLAGGIAHDFNNLLMVIMGHGELLRRGLAGDDPRLRKVQHVMGAAERAARLVRQLLAFSRKQVMETRVVDLNELVSEAARLLRPLLGEDVKVLTRLDPSLGPVRVDPAQFDQVLMNLAVNARDAMPAGGTLALETANLEGRAADLAAHDGYVALTVRDTGHGMDAETRAQAFEPFFTTKAGRGGTGLGLSMVYRTVHLHDGTIEVESTPGHGTTFRLSLPQA